MFTQRKSAKMKYNTGGDDDDDWLPFNNTTLPLVKENVIKEKMEIIKKDSMEILCLNIYFSILV
jgi:hypothetical protein